MTKTETLVQCVTFYSNLAGTLITSSDCVISSTVRTALLAKEHRKLRLVGSKKAQGQLTSTKSSFLAEIEGFDIISGQGNL